MTEATQANPIPEAGPSADTAGAAATPPPAERPALPDHLSIDPRSRFYNPAVFEHEVGIRLNGKLREDVVEYCISERWVKVPAGKTLDRKGNPLLITLKGGVEAFYL